MKLYGDYPHAWGRIKSIDVTPAEYACSVERTSTTTRGDLAVKWAVITAAVFLACLLLLEKLA